MPKIATTIEHKTQNTNINNDIIPNSLPKNRNGEMKWKVKEIIRIETSGDELPEESGAQVEYSE